MPNTKPKANFYIDGFNLYYGCVKGTSWKWLDIGALCQRMYQELEINQIRYFTAPISSPPADQSGPQRQQIFLRALQTIPNMSIHQGSFQCHPRNMRLVNPPQGGPNYTDVYYTEEKGSDVNLASYLLFDGFKNDYEVAIVVSNDSDLCEPIRLARVELGLQVGVLVPTVARERYPSHDLKQVSDPRFYRKIREKGLKACQFPPSLTDAKGKFSKPPSWP